MAMEPENSSLLGGHGQSDGENGGIQTFIRSFGHEAYRTFTRTLLCSPTNILLPCVPLGIFAAMNEWNSTAIFVLNFLAIVPLAEVVSFSTEELAKSVGQIFGGLINATFGNVIELLVSYFSPCLTRQLEKQI